MSMSQNKLVEEFYKEAAQTLNAEVYANTQLKDLAMTSGKYYALIAIMEDLGAEDITYKMVKKCETLAEVVDLMLENLEDE